MATYAPELDKALLPVPWIAKVDAESKPFMLKYSQHPSKPGYIILLTDLTKVYFEPLAGIRILARQREVEAKFGQSQSQRDGGSSLELGGEEAVGEVLDELERLMGEMSEAELEIKAGDLYDLDVTIKSAGANWLYHMTEIRYGCLEVITRHIVHPLALSIASSRRPASSTDDQIVELASSSIVLEAINRHSSHAKKPAEVKAMSSSPKTATAKPLPPSGMTDENERGGESSKSRLVRRRPRAASRPNDPGPSSPERVTRTKSPSPIRQHKTEKFIARTAAEDEMEDDSMPPEEEEEEHRASDPPPSPPRPREDKAVSPQGEDENMDAGEDGTPTPPIPPPSQRTQQEKDEEEEEELAKKREEMKRKMGAGGGGRLFRRRFG